MNIAIVILAVVGMAAVAYLVFQNKDRIAREVAREKAQADAVKAKVAETLGKVEAASNKVADAIDSVTK